MNWGLIAWVAGAMATLAGIRFVFVAFKTLLSKETMVGAIGAIGTGISNAGENFANFLKKKVDKQKAQKNEKPMIYIR